MLGDIIFAKASGDGLAALTVIRLSGDGAHALIARLCMGALPPLRRAALRKLKDPATGALLDQALILLFAKGASYTGEESAELHLHGGSAVLAAVLSALEALGARQASPGEFTRRALRSGALDLAEAEAVGALIAAETETARLQALRVLDGEVGRLAASWREKVIDAIGLLETGVDFVEEALGDDLIDEAADRVSDLRRSLGTHLEEAQRVTLLDEKPLVVLIGPPNAGKSSLLNAISGADRAIVSPVAGTTRDSVEVSIRLAGREVLLADTAGLRVSTDCLEQAGVARSRRLLEQADLRIFVVSSDTRHEFDPLVELMRPDDAIFWTKADVSPPANQPWPSVEGLMQRFVVSARRPELAREAIADYVSARFEDRPAPQSPLIGSDRRMNLVQRADDALALAQRRLDQGEIELAIEELRETARQLEALTGVIDQEDVLDAVFSRFCIGK